MTQGRCVKASVVFTRLGVFKAATTCKVLHGVRKRCTLSGWALCMAVQLKGSGLCWMGGQGELMVFPSLC